MELWLQYMAKNKIKKRKKREVRKKKKIDALFLVLIVAVLIMFASLLTPKTDLKEDLTSLREEANNILRELTDSTEFSIAPGNIINEERLKKISGMTYDNLKDNLDVENEFCVYFEDEDGNLVEVTGVKSIGSDVIDINGKPCGR